MADYATHLRNVTEALQNYAGRNDTQAIPEPGNDFERSVNAHAELQALIAKVKDILKPLETDERSMRDGIASSLVDYFGDNLKEGVNRYKLSNGRDLVFEHKIERKVDNASVPEARKLYEQAGGTKPFDDLLRVKYELDKRAYNSINDAEQLKALSRMVTAKSAAPVIKVD